VILPERPNAETLVLRAKAALQIGLVSSAVRDLNRATTLSDKDPYVKQAREELAKLHSQATEPWQASVRSSQLAVYRCSVSNTMTEAPDINVAWEIRVKKSQCVSIIWIDNRDK